MKCRRHNEENCAYCESQQSSFLDITDHEANKRMKEQIEQLEEEWRDVPEVSDE